MEITKWSNAFPEGWYISDSGEGEICIGSHRTNTIIMRLL